MEVIRIYGKVSGCISNERGMVIIFVAFMLIALLSFGALAVDLGYLYLVQSELQNAADAGALAGAGCLCDGKTEDQAQECARKVSLSNKTGTESVEEPSISVTSGKLVNVKIQRTSAPTFFARIFGTDTVSLSASATATYMDPDPGITGDEYPVLVE
jgi:Flp pilus assembly protein TadG